MFRAPKAGTHVQVMSSHLPINLYMLVSGPHLGSSSRTGERELHRPVVRTRARPSCRFLPNLADGEMAVCFPQGNSFTVLQSGGKYMAASIFCLMSPSS